MCKKHAERKEREKEAMDKARSGNSDAGKVSDKELFGRASSLIEVKKNGN